MCPKTVINSLIKHCVVLSFILQERYLSYATGLGEKIRSGAATLEECEEFVSKHGEPEQRSGQQEMYDAIINRYV